MLNDRFLPDDDVRLVRSVAVDAPADEVYEAIRPAQIGDDQLLAAATWLRELPQMALSFLQSGDREPIAPDTTVGDLLDHPACVPLAEDAGREIVVGAVGRFWNPLELVEGLTPEEFRADMGSGAKGVVSLSIHERHGDNGLLVLEARARGLNETGRQRLTRWTGFVKPVLGLLARRVLDVIRTDAEDGRSARVPTPTPTEVEAASGLLATIDDAELTDRRVLLRVDVNEPVEDGRIVGRDRLQAAADTIQTLLDRGAGVVVLAHQGRPGREDFLDLGQHAAILDETLAVPVDHVEAIDDDRAREAAGSVAPGEVLLLGNVRRAEGEMSDISPGGHARRDWVQALASRVDVFVNEAFSACHRSHASLVGFPELLPALAGPGLLAELEALERVGRQDEPRVAVLGGAKPGASLDAMAYQLARDRVDEVLVGGLLAASFLEADGVNTGQGTRALLEEHGYREHGRQARSLLDTYGDRIRLPTDVAVHRNGDRFEVPVDELPARGRIRDIGKDTADSFADHANDAGTLLVHGPMGVYEETPYDRGTHRVFSAAGKAEAYSVIGGGHTVQAMTQLGVPRERFDHVSLAGGALLSALAGEDLPAVEALRSREGPVQRGAGE